MQFENKGAEFVIAPVPTNNTTKKFGLLVPHFIYFTVVFILNLFQTQ
jgi:hypothetical protein